MIARFIIALGLSALLIGCTPKRNNQALSTEPDALPTTRGQWLATAQHTPVWYANHKRERRALLKTCDANHQLYRTNPDCQNAQSARLGAGDY